RALKLDLLSERAPHGVRAVNPAVGGLPDRHLVVRAELIGGGLTQSARARGEGATNARVGRGNDGRGAADVLRIGEGAVSQGIVGGAAADIGGRDTTRLGLVDSAA